MSVCPGEGAGGIPLPLVPGPLWARVFSGPVQSTVPGLAAGERVVPQPGQDRGYPRQIGATSYRQDRGCPPPDRRASDATLRAGTPLVVTQEDFLVLDGNC